MSSKLTTPSRILSFDETHLKRDADGTILTPIILEGGFLFPHVGGCIYQGIKYTQHALERMAPCTSDIMDVLLNRAFIALESAQNHTNYYNIDPESGFKTYVQFWWEEFCPSPRGIRPDSIREEYDRESRTDYRVIRGVDGSIVTVYPANGCKHLDENNPLIEDALKRLKIRARHVKERQKLQIAKHHNPNKVNYKQKAEEFLWRKMKYSLKLTPSLDVKAKEWQHEINKAKEKRNNKVIDISDIKASRKAAQLQAKSTVIKSDETKSVSKANNTMTVNKADMCPINSSKRVSDNVTTVDAVDVVESVVRTSTTTVAVCDTCDEVKETVETVPESWEDAF